MTVYIEADPNEVAVYSFESDGGGGAWVPIPGKSGGLDAGESADVTFTAPPARVRLMATESLRVGMAPLTAPAGDPYPVRRDTIWQRLKATVGAPTAHAIVNGFTTEQRNEWFGNDYFLSTNPDVIALCTALGLDPAALLAPDAP